MGIERIGINFIRTANQIPSGINNAAKMAKIAEPKTNRSTGKLVERFQAIRTRIIRKDIDKYILESTAKNFETSKQRLISLLSNSVDKSLLERLSNSQDSVYMDIIIQKELRRLEQDFLKTIELSKRVSGNKITLELEQECNKFLKMRENLILAREKAFYVKSVNPKVVEIENILKEKYGVKFVNLKDNEQKAKLILKAFEIAKKNNKSLPENVFVSDFVMLQGEYCPNSKSVIYASDTITDLIKFASQKAAKKFDEKDVEMLREFFIKKQERWYSTSLPEHVMLHEILHVDHPQLLAYKAKEIPSEFSYVKRSLGEYSAKKKNHETFVELDTKKCLSGLNEQEEKLYNYLNFFA